MIPDLMVNNNNFDGSAILRCLTLPNTIKFLIDPHNQLPYAFFF